MWLSELLYDDVVKVGLEARDKWEAIEELVDLLISTHELRMNDRQEIKDALFARERSLSTGMEHGIAIPHAVVSCVDSVVAALGISKEGLPFDSLDGQPAKLVALILIPKGAFQRHVRTLSGIARLSSDADCRQRLFTAESSSELMGIIYEQDEKEAEKQ